MMKELAVVRATTQLRSDGWKPYYHPLTGQLIEWRRIKGRKLQRCEVQVHDSGRVTVHYRSNDA